MKQFLCTLLLTCAVVMSSSTAFADTFSFKEAQAEFSYSSDWGMERKDGKVTLTASDKSLVLVFNEIKTAPLKLLKEGLQAGLKTSDASNIQPLPDQAMDGFMIVGFTGTKEIKGEPREMALFTYVTPSKTKCVMAAVIEVKKPSERVKQEAFKLIRQVKVTQ